MRRPLRRLNCLLAAGLLAAGLPFTSEAKSYSSGGGHSYSSHSSSFGGSHSSSGSSHSFSSGGGHTFGSGGSHGSSAGGSSGSGISHSFSSQSAGGHSFDSGGGKSYSSGSTWSGSGRHSYSSAKSYSSGSARSTELEPNLPHVTFDTAAARASKEAASKEQFTRFKDAQRSPPRAADSARASGSGTPIPRSDGAGTPVTSAGAPSYRVKPPPLPASSGGSYRRPVYIPDAGTLSSRPVRIYNVFNPYWTRPVVIYHDPYNSFFWWWLLDRSLDDRAWWAYHHRYDMDPARYQALVANDQQLEARVEQLEAQQAPRNPNYVPTGLDQDLMYSDQYVTRTYSNRPTTQGVIAFWVLAIPTALGVSAFFIWLIWFKRWQTAT